MEKEGLNFTSPETSDVRWSDELVGISYLKAYFFIFKLNKNSLN
jgi:hypothetical protein